MSDGFLGSSREAAEQGTVQDGRTEELPHASAFTHPPVSAALFENCTGCVMCSEENGCISCQQRLFLLIWRDGIRQNGACVHACPPGYFGVRGQEVNRCIKCKSPSCDSCFSKDFCMKCKERFYLHKGKCLGACPPSTTAQHGTRECLEKCEMGPWGDWGPCTNQGRTCGSRWGSATRVREVVGSSKEDAAACPGLSESRKCRMKKHCPGEKNENKRKEKRGKKQKKKKKPNSQMVT
ncbi:R-spondin-4 [Varanus komodoensis]|uniref:R-spondin-4 n=1 Tax=Varanus komodoensis TaxID=61221 RepID=UPI001CF7BAC9|nr:R-spondin-4 [Varanus komodoensis]